MNNIDLNSKQWCELVFEGKNHDFGAYEMRRDSAARHNKAMLIVTILAIVVILLPSIIRFVAPKKEAEEKMTEVTTLSKLPPAEVKQEELIKPDAPRSTQMQSSLKVAARVIKSMGIKMVLSGEGADEVFGGYLYFHKAPAARAFPEETVR